MFHLETPHRRGSNAAVFSILFALIALGAAPVSAQDHVHPPGDLATLGTVDFGIGCSPAVAEEFEQAVAMLHSFWFAEAVAAFRSVAASDPSCAMAQWGIAMTEMGNPNQ
jgi:hypothetical protein